jgi:hypothetical protein
MQERVYREAMGRTWPNLCVDFPAFAAYPQTGSVRWRGHPGVASAELVAALVERS